MARQLRSIEIEHADRGVVIHVEDFEDPVLGLHQHTEIIEGYGETANFKDRVRRRLNEIVGEWYPTTPSK